MDWKYKHFEREAVFPARRELVAEAARTFLAESLGWKMSDTADGFEATGHSGGHAAIAKFRIELAPAGTKVAVALLVERASPLGFMLADVGSYYDRQIRHWLDGIQACVNQKLAPAGQPEAAAAVQQAVAKARRGPALFIGCVLAFFLFVALIYVIAALIGLMTGHLYIPGRGGGDVTLHGPWARIVSALMLAGLAWLVFRVFKSRKPNRGSGWLPGPSK